MAGQFVIKQIAQEVISEVNQPLYIGGKLADGSDAKLTVATDGSISTATPLTVPSLTVNSKPVMSSLLAEYTVTGSPVTSIDFSGLDINTHKSYRVEMDLYNPTASNDTISMFVNGDTTTTNYYRQGIDTVSTGLSSARINSSQVSYIEASKEVKATVSLSLSNGYPLFSGILNKNRGLDIGMTVFFGTKTASVTNITQLTFTASVANSIGVGSTIRIYRGDV